MQVATQRIRQLVKQTLQSIIAVGNELLAVKAALPYGRFGPWLRGEFAWGERMARNFMAVAQSFGGSSANVAELPIEPTAAYLLAAPSVPEEARREAIKRAESGEPITGPVAREILESLRKQPEGQATHGDSSPRGQMRLGELLETLESIRQRWGKQQVDQLARQLHDFADSLKKK